MQMFFSPVYGLSFIIFKVLNLFIVFIMNGYVHINKKIQKVQKNLQWKFPSHSCSFMQFLSPEALWLHSLRTLFILSLVYRNFNVFKCINLFFVDCALSTLFKKHFLCLINLFFCFLKFLKFGFLYLDFFLAGICFFCRYDVR